MNTHTPQFKTAPHNHPDAFYAKTVSIMDSYDSDATRIPIDLWYENGKTLAVYKTDGTWFAYYQTDKGYSRPSMKAS